MKLRDLLEGRMKDEMSKMIEHAASAVGGYHKGDEEKLQLIIDKVLKLDSQKLFKNDREMVEQMVLSELD